MHVVNHDYLATLKASIHWPRNAFRGYLCEDGTPKDRVIKHDVLHLLLAGDGPSPLRLKFEDEYAVAIVQAVLEGALKLSKVNVGRVAGRDVPRTQIITTDAVREQTIRDAVRFMQKELQQENRIVPASFREQLSEDFILHYIEVGNAFKTHFAGMFGQEYVSMPVATFMEIPLPVLKANFQEAVSSVKPYTPMAANGR